MGERERATCVWCGEERHRSRMERYKDGSFCCDACADDDHEYDTEADLVTLFESRGGR